MASSTKEGEVCDRIATHPKRELPRCLCSVGAFAVDGRIHDVLTRWESQPNRWGHWPLHESTKREVDCRHGLRVLVDDARREALELSAWDKRRGCFYAARHPKCDICFNRLQVIPEENTAGEE